MSINDRTMLPWTDLTFEQARNQLSAFHFSQESLTPGERQILYIAEGLLRLVDPESYGIVLDDLAQKVEEKNEKDKLIRAIMNSDLESVSVATLEQIVFLVATDAES